MGKCKIEAKQVDADFGATNGYWKWQCSEHGYGPFTYATQRGAEEGGGWHIEEKLRKEKE